MIVRCTRCGKKNKVPVERIGQTGRCGSCGGTLGVSDTAAVPIEVTGEDFDKAVAGFHVPVLVDFYSNACSPCLALAPAIDSIAADRAGRLIVAKVNIDANPQVAIRFGVRGVPTLMVVRDGTEVDRLVGGPSEADLRQWVDQHL